VNNHCVECHREKGLAPFSLETADDITSHAGMIKTVVENGTMPPWFAKDQQASKWSNDPSLNDTQKSDLLKWLASERTMGNPEEAPLKPKFDSQWSIGTPDKILQIRRPFNIPATGIMPYQYTQIETKFPEDRWISGVEIRPTNRAVVHHVLVFLAGRSEAGNLRGTDGFFAAYVPGNSHQIFPDGFAKKIPAGSRLLFQIHYTPVGKATRDQTQIGLKFYSGQPRHVIRVKGIANRRLRIPAGAENHPEKATLRLPTDVKLLAFMPHMHLRGKAFRYDFIDRDTGKQTILDIPRYDFNWQLVYRLAEPMLAKRGSTLEATGWFDNSENNPANPDPNQVVRWGDQTHEEMMLGYVEYYLPDESVSPEPKQRNAPNPQSGTRRAKISRAITSGAFQRYDKNGD
ncbi:MAG: redoxin, partial [Planctomycetota bacterium]|nr:redoxin [Planctomycetota bacterium]